MSQTGLSLPHREQEWYGARLEDFNALPTSLQTKKIREMSALLTAAGLTKKQKIADKSVEVAAVAAAPILDLEGLTVLAIFVATCGTANAETYLATYKGSDRARKSLAVSLVREAFRYATAPAVRLAGPAPVDNTITLADVRREKEAEAAAAAEALRVATFVPPALTPHMTKAYEMGMAGETLRLSADLGDQELLESGRKLAVKFHWQHIFVLLAQEVTLIHKEHLEQRIDRHVNVQMDLNEAVAAYEALWFCPMPTDAGDAYILKRKRAADMESWSRISSLERAATQTYNRCAAKALIIAGVHILMRKWWKQAPKTAPRVKKHVRLTVAEKAVRHNEVVQKLLPSYLVARDISTFTKPVETIQTIRLGNLREARGDAQVRDLNQDIRSFIERNGGVITQERGAVFVPLISRTRQTQGYCFVKLTSPANARLLLDRLATLTHAMLIDSRTGEEREVFPELAASDRKSKEQMEAEKRAPKPVSLVDEATQALKNALRGVELKPIRLASLRVTAAEDAAFPALCEAATEVPRFEVSFAQTVAKRPAEVQKVIDPSTVRLNGEEYAVAAAPGSALAILQERLRSAAAEALGVTPVRKTETVEIDGWATEVTMEEKREVVVVKKEEPEWKVRFLESLKRGVRK